MLPSFMRLKWQKTQSVVHSFGLIKPQNFHSQDETFVLYSFFMQLVILILTARLWSPAVLSITFVSFSFFIETLFQVL